MKTPTVTVLSADPITVTTADVVASVEAEGYSLRITRNGAPTCTAVLTKPDGKGGMHLYRWPNLARVYESMSLYFLQRGLPHVWTALKAAVEREMRS